jgi:hypothetical protein
VPLLPPVPLVPEAGEVVEGAVGAGRFPEQVADGAGEREPGAPTVAAYGSPS